MNCAVCGHELPEAAAFCPCCAHATGGAAECDDYAYEAFISYCHTPEDRALARRIQRRIEGRRIPRELRQDGRARLGKCFRDEDELPTSDSLPHLIEDALRHSRFLIVICSPRMRESLWVAREVELFSAYHGRDRVLLALADGEPAEAFPPLLMSITEKNDGGLVEREAEPVAADMRRGAGKRFSSELLRILAPIMGCGYDDLRQRERARRLRNVAVATGAAAAVAASFGAFALFQQAQIQANYEEALINQSEYLAEEATTLLGAGNRMQALQVALFALGEEGGIAGAEDRPYVPAACVALEEACQVYPGTYWRPLYANQEEAGVSDAFVSPDGSAYAAVLADDSVRTYDVATGCALCAVEAPSGDEYRSDVALIDEGVLCLDSENSIKTLTLRDARTGERLWTRALSWDASELVLSPDGSLVATFSDDAWDTEGATVAVLSTTDGTTTVRAQTLPFAEGDDELEFSLPTDPAAFSEGGRTLVQAVGRSVWVLDITAGTWRSVRSESGLVTSVVVTDDMIYLGCFDQKDEKSESVINALDLATLELAWSWRAPATGSLASTHAPRLFEVGDAELGPGLLAGVGHHLLVLDAQTGEVDLDALCPDIVGTARLLGGAIAYESGGKLYRLGRSQTFYLGSGEAYVGGGNSAPTTAKGGEPEPGLDGVRIFRNPGGETLCLLGGNSRTAVYRLDRAFNLPGREELSDDASAALSDARDARSANGSYILTRPYEDDVINVLDGDTFELERTIDLARVAPDAVEASSYDVAVSPVDDDLVYLSWAEYPTGEPSHDVLCALDVSTGEVAGMAELPGEPWSDFEVFDGSMRLVTHTYSSALQAYSLMTLDARTLEIRSEIPLQIHDTYHHIEDVGTLVGADGGTVLLVIDDELVAFDAQMGAQVELSLSGLVPETTNVAVSAQASANLGFGFDTSRSARLLFNDDHSRLLLASSDGTVSLYDASGELSWKLPAATFGTASFLMFLPSGDILVQGGSAATFMGQHLLVDGETGEVLASSDDASLIGSAWLSQDGTSLVATSKSYAMGNLSSSFIDGVFTISLDPEAFGVESQMYLADAITPDGTRALFYDQVQKEYFTLPVLSTKDLVARAHELTEGHELTDAERRLYHLE